MRIHKNRIILLYGYCERLDFAGLDGRSGFPAVQCLDVRRRGVNSAQFRLQRLLVGDYSELPDERFIVRFQYQRFRGMASNILRTR